MARSVSLNVAQDTQVLIEPDHAAEACRILIRAYANNPEDVDWSDVQAALEAGLRAFHLPADYPERVYFEGEV